LFRLRHRVRLAVLVSLGENASQVQTSDASALRIAILWRIYFRRTRRPAPFLQGFGRYGAIRSPLFDERILGARRIWNRGGISRDRIKGA
jgi:hypothetical protein